MNPIDKKLQEQVAREITGTPGNPYHRSGNSVRTKPRKPFGKGPVVKGKAFGRCRPNGGARYT